MQNPSKPYVIVVGIDYSPASDLALQRAFALAAPHSPAEVHVVSVVQLYGAQALIDYPADPSGMASVSTSEAAAQVGTYAAQQWRKFVDNEHERVPNDARATRVVPHLRMQAPAREIAQIAADLDADLVVVGTHGRGGISRLLLGSVAESVVRLAPCPVLVVRDKVVPNVELAETSEPAEGSPPIPRIEPPCPRCVETRRATNGAEYWCEDHRARHGQRHTYHQADRAGEETEMPLVFHN